MSCGSVRGGGVVAERGGEGRRGAEKGGELMARRARRAGGLGGREGAGLGVSRLSRDPSPSAHALPLTPSRSHPAAVGGHPVAEDAGLELELMEAVLQDVADGDDAGEVTAVADHQVTESFAGHACGHVTDGIVGGAAGDGASHDGLDREGGGPLGMVVDRPDDIPFGEEADGNPRVVDDRERADVVAGQPLGGAGEGLAAVYGDDVGAGRHDITYSHHPSTARVGGRLRGGPAAVVIIHGKGAEVREWGVSCWGRSWRERN